MLASLPQSYVRLSLKKPGLALALRVLLTEEAALSPPLGPLCLCVNIAKAQQLSHLS